MGRQYHITDSDGNKITSTSSGGKRSLDVNVNGGNLNATNGQFSPRFYHSKTDISLSQSSDTELANITLPSGVASGKIDAISVNFDRDDVEFVLEVDDVEILRIRLDYLAASGKYNLESDENEGDDDD